MKIEFIPVNTVSQEVLDRNKLATSRLALPTVGTRPSTRRPLALVGGGPSVCDYVDELKAFNGDIWAINGAWKWCRDNGIDATFYTIDPLPEIAGMVDGVKSAILGDVCDPSVFEKISGDIQIFPIGEIPSGSTSASTCIMIAALCGYSHLTLYGCDSSFTETKTHVYDGWSPGESRVLAKCGDEEFLTCPQMIMQAEYMAEVIRGVPEYVTIRSGGLLPALVEHGDWDALKVSRNLMDAINGQHELQHS